MSIILKYGLKINKLILITDIISASLMLLLLYTAVSKLLNYESFKSVLIMSPFLRPFAGIIAWLLPAAEIVIVILLFFQKTRLKGLYVSFITIAIFTVYITCMVIFTPRLPCNCGGVLKSLTWTQHIFFNLFILLLTVTGIVLYRKINNVATIVPP